MFKFTQVALCKNSVADQIVAHPTAIKNSIKGDLQILLETSTGMLMFKMKDFQYGVNPNDEILFEDHDSEYKLMLCLDSNPSNAWVLKIKDNAQLVFFILSERCKLIHRKAAKMIIEGTNEYPKLDNLQRNKYVPQIPQQRQSQYKLIQASKIFANGLATAGLLVSKGLEALGSYLSKSIDPAQAIVLSPQTKIMIEKSVDASKRTLAFSTEKIANIFRLATGDAKNIQQRISHNQSNQSQQIKKKGSLRIGLEAITNVYDGYVKCYDEASNGLSKGANHIISAKYGKDAGDAALKIAQGVRNVNKFPKVANDALKQVLLETAKNHMKN